MNRAEIEKSVSKIVMQELHNKNYVTHIDILVGIGWLKLVHVQEWRKGKVPYLERVVEGNLAKISYAMKCFRKLSIKMGLKPSFTAYMMRFRGGKKPLQFSKSNNSKIEKAYQTHYVSPLLSEKKQGKLKEKLEQPPELLVFMITKDTVCTKCKEVLLKGSIIYLEDDQALCMKCSPFNKFIFLGSGDMKLTLRAKKYSSKYAIVMKFSKTRKRYERQGIMVTQEALEKAQDSIS